MRAVSQGLSFRMKDLQLTWLHSCLLGARWYDYRAEVVPPTSSSMDQHAFQGDQMSRRWEGWPQLLLLSCCCFADATAFCRCYLWTCANPYTLCSFRTHKVVFQGVYRIMSSSFKCFILLRCCPNLFLVRVCSISSATSGNVLVLRVYWVQIQFRHDHFLLPPVVLVLYTAGVKKSDLFDKSRPDSIAQLCRLTFVLLVERKMELDIYSLWESH